ncbi:MAG: 23S rRNA (pseudouridine(1915)-N(3))-methyltransferase RlmH [Gemmatimonadota bacterium]|nr:23S rRNA (pseudouridine(1915)-N(3))-methyltransferase RlmH [Gemmatimonadota bacterium]
MRIIIAAVGRPKDQALAAAIRDYEVRAARYWPIEICEVKAERADSASDGSMVRMREGERLRERIGSAPTTVACDVGGTTMTSESFASWLQQKRERAQDVAFVVGGATGLDPALRADAGMRLSLAPWTLPHELARLVLAEQLYRAGTIIRGEPYHK